MMLRFVLRRLLTLPLLMLAIYGGAALLLVAAPGESLDTGARDLSPEVLHQRRIAFNYDQPWPVRYFWTWPRRLLWDRDLPTQHYQDWTVFEIIRAALPVSLQLGLITFALAVCLGLTVGVLAAVCHAGWFDRLAMAATILVVSLPTFVIGALLLIVFGVWLRWTPVGGWGAPGQALLPAITLALPYAAYIARLTRTAMHDALREDYVRTARAKGLPGWRVALDHALPSAMIPVLSYLGPTAAAVFTGSFVVEKVFNIPGMGTHVVEAIHNRDEPMILATVLVYGGLLAVCNLVVDLLYGLVDPRISVGGRSA